MNPRGRMVALVLAWVLGIIAALWTVAMVAFLAWDVSRARWVNVPLDVVFGVVSAVCVRACLRFRRRLTTS